MSVLYMSLKIGLGQIMNDRFYLKKKKTTSIKGRPERAPTELSLGQQLAWYVIQATITKSYGWTVQSVTDQMGTKHNLSTFLAVCQRQRQLLRQDHKEMWVVDRKVEELFLWQNTSLLLGKEKCSPWQHWVAKKPRLKTRSGRAAVTPPFEFCGSVSY